MSFRTPMWLWLVAAIPLLTILLVALERRRVAVARRFMSERLRGVANPARALRPYLLALSSAGLAVALAGPYAGFMTVPITARELNRVIAIDVSHSMSAEDVGVSRLAAAKAIAKRIIEQQSGRAALIAFEASAETVSPLTNDTDAVLALLDTLQPGEVGQAGSDLGAAILASLRLVDAEPGQKADVILISDGEEQGRRLADAIRRARTRSVRVSAILVGSEDGSVIPAGDGVLRDESGDIVKTYARADVLERIAGGTAGVFLDNPFASESLDPLLARGIPGAAKEKYVRVPVDRYQWPLGFAFILFFCASLLNRGAE